MCEKFPNSHRRLTVWMPLLLVPVSLDPDLEEEADVGREVELVVFAFVKEAAK